MQLATIPIRVARPSRDLAAARSFWVDGLGLSVLWQTGPEAEGGHSLLMVGAPGAAWHMELVEDEAAHAASHPSPEDLLVLYLGHAPDDAVIDRLLSRGGVRVTSPNPYWERFGVTIMDPDGYRLVLSARTWESRALPPG